MSAEPYDVREMLGLEREQLPRHIAVIMDGNGRWAQARGLPRIHGHRQGAKSVREIVQACSRLGLEALTLYSFSIENWKRPKDEVSSLMQLYAEYLVKERDELMETDTRLVQIGRRDNLPQNVIDELDRTMALSAGNSGLTLCLALNYGSRYEMVEAARRLAARVAAGELTVDQIDEERFSDSLYTAGLPDPDLLIRTAGEYRLSNFLLWQISYAEFYVTDVYWPDFRTEHLLKAIREYAHRERRFGEVPQFGGQSDER
ncbi:MAG: isoprenyl transferase [Phycisphaerae bacterium]|nr:isoprenyl transferase [Phycisphaerae bacterium]